MRPLRHHHAAPTITPFSQSGKRPPCTKRGTFPILAAGSLRSIRGVRPPTPRNSGSGCARVRWSVLVCCCGGVVVGTKRNTKAPGHGCRAPRLTCTGPTSPVSKLSAPSPHTTRALQQTTSGRDSPCKSSPVVLQVSYAARENPLPRPGIEPGTLRSSVLRSPS